MQPEPETSFNFKYANILFHPGGQKRQHEGESLNSLYPERVGSADVLS